METRLAELVGNAIIKAGEQIKAGTCELTDDEAMNILNIVSHQVMSREEVCVYLNITNNKFYELIARNKIPAGKKRRGFKELCWYKDEIDNLVL